MRILIGAPVRQDPEVFVRYLAGLRSLQVPAGVELDFCWILHNSSDLAVYLQSGEQYAVFNDTDSPDYQTDDHTHHWNNTLIQKVTAMKNTLLHKARVEGYDYFWLVDSDIVVQPETLTSLLNTKKDIVAEVFWTRWTPDQPEMPNAWDADHYSFYAGNPERWRTPGLYQVGMTGACVLLSRNVLEAEITYHRVPNLTFWGEDRHFCVRAMCAGFSLWLDTHYPAVHLYRKSDLGG